MKVLLPEKKELVYSTGLKIVHRNWDDKNQKVRNKEEVVIIKNSINNKLTNIYSFVEENYVNLQIQGDLNKNNLKVVLGHRIFNSKVLQL